MGRIKPHAGCVRWAPWGQASATSTRAAVRCRSSCRSIKKKLDVPSLSPAKQQQFLEAIRREVGGAATARGRACHQDGAGRPASPGLCSLRRSSWPAADSRACQPPSAPRPYQQCCARALRPVPTRAGCCAAPPAGGPECGPTGGGVRGWPRRLHCHGVLQASRVSPETPGRRGGAAALAGAGGGGGGRQLERYREDYTNM